MRLEIYFFQRQTRELNCDKSYRNFVNFRNKFLCVPNKVAIVDNYIVKSRPNFLELMQYQATMWSCVFVIHSFWQYFPGGHVKCCHLFGEYLNIYPYNLVKTWHDGSKDFQEWGKVEFFLLTFFLQEL